MTKPATYPVEATMGQDGQLLVRYSESVTGSPQAITELHADYREVTPQHGGKTLTEGFISELSSLYEFRDDLVEGFLEENPSLGSLLFEAYKIIPDYFGSEVETALEVVADPEAPGDRELFVVIRTELPPMKARALLSELDQGWWRDVSPVAEGKMEFALE
jgi:hypothetical protein